MLLDTNIISESWRVMANDRVLAWLDEQRDRDFYICTPVLSELSYGIERLRDGARRRHLVNSFDTLVTKHADRILVFDERAALRLARIRLARERIGHPLDLLDGMIASIALVNEMPLVTRNTRDFGGIELVLINPFS